jgi:hypothetical protein
VLVVIALLVAAKPSQELSGFNRLRATLPSASLTSVKAFVSEMWNRNHYGEASTQMIREFPLVGVGVGAFSTLVIDYGKQFNGGESLTPDNAQNWYRHQLAQMGIVGSLGWIVWMGLLAAFVWRTLRSAEARPRRFEATVIAGILAGVAVVSLVGMPTANTAAALTMMVFVFWYVAVVDPDGRVLASGQARDRHITWTRAERAACGVLIAFLAGTAFVGWTRLRPPQRALRFGWEYASGFYDHERLASGALFRWTGGRAVDVVPVTDRYLRLRFWVSHPDVERQPVEVKIWLQDRLVIDDMAHSVEPVTAYVRTPDGQPRVMIEARVSRTWKPGDYGQQDSRDLGLALEDWTFVSEPPAGATVVTDVHQSPRNR